MSRPSRLASPLTNGVPDTPTNPAKAASSAAFSVVEQGEQMNIDKAVLALAGTFTLLGVVLGTLVSPWCLLLAAFAGLNQLQASMTGFCPAALLLRRAGVESGTAFK